MCYALHVFTAMSQDISPRAIGVRWFEEVWNARNTGAIREMMSPMAKAHLEGGMDICGPEAFMDFFQAFLLALPDLRLDLLKTVSDGEDVFVHWKARGTHAGAAFGFEPSGRGIEFSGITRMRVVDGRIIEGWDCWNQEGLFAVLAGRPRAASC